MNQAIFECQSIRQSYQGQTVLDIPSLSFKSDAIIGLMGPNGSGKSSFLRLLGLIERPRTGQLFFQGTPVEPFNARARFQIALLPQEAHLLKRSVFKNIAYGLKLRGDQKNIEKRVSDALYMLGLNGSMYFQRPWYALSGGETQRVALAARLILRPKVLLLDEPIANVDIASAQLIKCAILKARREWGTTIVIASHDAHWLFQVCDDIYTIFRGCVLPSPNQTVIVGPWQAVSTDSWCRKLSDSQTIVIPQPPHKDAVARIQFFFSEDIDHSGKIRHQSLHGVITQLTREKGANAYYASIMIADLSFSMELPQMLVHQKKLFPGTGIEIYYRPEDTHWL